MNSLLSKNMIPVLFVVIFYSFCLMKAYTEENQKIYDNTKNVELIKKINHLEAKELLCLGKFKVMPENAKEIHNSYENGPGRRDYSNKMVYSSVRGTALYCGANHQSPHRLNDVWEFHLPSNTWHLIQAPGFDASHARNSSNALKKLKAKAEKEALSEEEKASVKKYEEVALKYHTSWVVKDGYLQDSANGGPVEPWHTWDGLTFDEETQRLYWAVLDSDQFQNEKHQIHRALTKRYAMSTSQNADELLKQLKDGSSMYMYDIKEKRWFKQLGEGPFPIMRGMGGTLHYLPDLKKTIWYACVGNTPSGYTEGMWAYDAKTNRWENLIPGGTVASLMKNQQAPGEELQVAYSLKHQKLIAVQKEMTFVYDVKKNEWSRVADNTGFGHDAHGVFVYDSSADVCLLLSKKGGRWSKEPWQISAYDITNNQWQVIEIKGAMPVDNPDKAWLNHSFAGYYDVEYNVFVLYNGRNQQTYLYRHQK